MVLLDAEQSIRDVQRQGQQHGATGVGAASGMECLLPRERCQEGGEREGNEGDIGARSSWTCFCNLSHCRIGTNQGVQLWTVKHGAETGESKRAFMTRKGGGHLRVYDNTAGVD